ncbi:hypothetical protein P692DRAFT_201806312 [Suillus brevipes Sb2]|nr:hypothetical protein P692DRAFT_201806312 [Suillus brevipes Sb2]
MKIFNKSSITWFDHVHKFLLKLNRRPFIKRFLRSDEIQQEIQACDKALGDAMQMFSISIQIRILKECKRFAIERRLDAGHAAQGLSPPPIYASPSQQTVPISISISSERTPRVGIAALPEPHDILPAAPGLSKSPPAQNAPLSPLQSQTGSTLPVTAPISPLVELQHLHIAKNASDREQDRELFHSTLQRIISARRDDEVLQVLGVRPGEVPEALKAFRRAEEALRDANAKQEGDLFEDGLKRVCVETGFEAMTRLSSVAVQKVEDKDVDVPWDLPPSTITRGSFCKVYLGSWSGRRVAIKVLSSHTSASLFRKEVEIWRQLKHKNVLRMWGASSAQGERPWFIVSEYCSGGSLVGWLKERKGSVGGALIPPGKGDMDFLRCMHHISWGMVYLHEQNALHEDLKASNVLVDERDEVGGVEEEQEAYCQWDAALTSPRTTRRSRESVKSYGCQNKRAEIPSTRITSLVEPLIQDCWVLDPVQRPAFTHIAATLKRLRKHQGEVESPIPVQAERLWKNSSSPPYQSPSMHPAALPATSPSIMGNESDTSLGDEFNTASAGDTDSFTLPLWSPSHVELGAVGYLSAPKGEFITLFNAMKPQRTAGSKVTNIPSLNGYLEGPIGTGKKFNLMRTMTQRGLELFSGLLTFPLTDRDETYSVYDVPFKANVKAIVKEYAPRHPIQKEDIILVFGTLCAPEYALFVSHSHPNGQAHFNIFSDRESGRPWDGWFAHGGGRNFNRNLKYLNLSGNKKSDLKRNNDGKRVLDEHGRVLSDFSRLSHLRALGLMDVMTTFLPNIPEDSDERRVRTSQTEVNGMSYGIANTVGRNGYLITVDLVPTSPGNNILSKYLHDNYASVFTEQLAQLKKDQKGERRDDLQDALRRAIPNHLVILTNSEVDARLTSAHPPLAALGITNYSVRPEAANHSLMDAIYLSSNDHGS